VLDHTIDRAAWRALVDQADPTSVAFAERALERSWVCGVLE
jgi:hypothetical protein